MAPCSPRARVLWSLPHFNAHDNPGADRYSHFSGGETEAARLAKSPKATRPEISAAPLPAPHLCPPWSQVPVVLVSWCCDDKAPLTAWEGGAWNDRRLCRCSPDACKSSQRPTCWPLGPLLSEEACVPAPRGLPAGRTDHPSPAKTPALHLGASPVTHLLSWSL